MLHGSKVIDGDVQGEYLFGVLAPGRAMARTSAVNSAQNTPIFPIMDMQ
jgi:hypothetical protein